MSYVKSEAQAADIFTKAFSDGNKWEHACKQIDHIRVGNKRGAAAPVLKGREQERKPLRRVVEFCCSDQSLFSSEAERRGIAVTRLTIADDVTTPRGLAKASSACKEEGVLLWAAMPCTGGSPWQHINKRYASARAKIEKRRELHM